MNSLPHIQPPKFFLRFFRWFCDPAIVEDIEGDLREIFERDIEAGNITKAKLQFSVRILGLFRPGIIKKIGRSSLNHPSPMFKNYFITSVRLLVRSAGFSTINIVGLAGNGREFGEVIYIR